MATEMGKAIIQNSSMQILLKQSSAAIDKIADVFYLSEGEKHLLLAADVGQGLFFAGPAHAAMRVVSSPEEHALATTKPQDTINAAKAAATAQSVTEAKHEDVPPTVEKVVPPQLPRSNRPMFTVETVGNTAPKT
jgi:hypothetical protein